MIKSYFKGSFVSVFSDDKSNEKYHVVQCKETYTWYLEQIEPFSLMNLISKFLVSAELIINIYPKFWKIIWINKIKKEV